MVVTGQQVGLFLGPLYGFYKAASAIAVARALAAESGVRCVPLFWLQTEDHDFAEIASATVAGSGGEPIALSLPPARPPPRRASRIAHRRLTAEVGPLLDSSRSCWAPVRPPGRRWPSSERTTRPDARSPRRSPASWRSCSPTRGS